MSETMISARTAPDQSRIVISQIVITDQSAVEALSPLGEDERRALAEMATTIAARSLRECEETGLISNIKDAVTEDREDMLSQFWENMRQELQDHRKLVESTLQKDGQLLQKELTAKVQVNVSEIEDKLKSPLMAADTRSQTIKQDLAGIRQLLAERQGADQIIEKTTAKGLKFQEEAADVLEDLWPKATVQRVWNSKGAKNNKKGDIVFQRQKGSRIVY